MGTRIRALGFPVFQKDWLFHVFKVSQGQLAGVDNGDSSWLSTSALKKRFDREWKDVQESKPGTFKHVILRIANWVLAQEDPVEAFFKSVPTKGKNNEVEILYPDTYQEVFVRRHLLFTARNREKYHKAWFRVTGVGIIPLLPLAITPLPNVPIYYLAYRVYSHHQAWQGAVAVLEHLQHLETYKPTAPDPEAVVQTLRNTTNLHATFDSSVTVRMEFKPDSDLSSLSRSRERGDTPLQDEEATALQEHYGAANLVAAVRKIRMKALES